MAHAALTILLQSLDQYSNPNRFFFLVTNHGLRSLNENLKFLQEFLENSTNNSKYPESMNSFETKIRDLSYKAQDVIEEFVFQNSCRSEEAIDIFDPQYSVHLTLHQILGEIDSIKAEAIQIQEKISADESMVKEEIHEKVSEDGSIVKYLAKSTDIEEYCSSDSEDIVAESFDGGLKMILDRLISSCPGLEFYSFVGLHNHESGRLANLARLVNEHPLVVDHFDRVFIIVCEELVFLRQHIPYTLVLDRFQRGELASSTRDFVPGGKAEILYKELRSKRYLVFLTITTSAVPTFIHLERWFPENHNRSRVILINHWMAITTRPSLHTHSPIHVNKSGIAKMLPKLLFCLKYKKKPFSLQKHFAYLNFWEGWEYLRKKVFAEDSCPPQLIHIAMEIVDNCAGVKQVLDEAARLLSESRKTPEDWKYAAKAIGCVVQIFFPDKVFYLYNGMLRFSEEEEQVNTVVGIDADIIRIRDHLTARLPRLKIITILGMGGIGKTTLAKAVFGDSSIRYHFHIRAWVKVSQVYNLREMLLGLLKEIGPSGNEIHRMNKDDLREMLYRCLKGQRFLIVMDDMWSTQAWDEMRSSFPDDENGSRILLTSRLTNLADHVNSNYTHKMRFLNKHHSWNLLQQRIFLNERCPSELVDTGKKIAERCKGLPLAILVVAGVLFNLSHTRECWETVAETMTKVLTSDPEHYLGLLAMSYSYLPQHLKACFLYLCVFPEDCEIECWRLVQLWVGEGFVKPEGFRSLEEMAELYLEDLINRNLVLVGKRSSSRNIKTCYIHDLLRDLSLREVKRENFVHVVMGQAQVPSENSSIVRRLSLHSGTSADFHSDHSIQVTHSLLCFDIGFDDIQVFLSTFKFRLLRVLDIGFMRFDYFPLVVLRLVHLRFISLTAACDLPSAISELWNLQTVIVQGPWLRRKYGRSPTLPIEIWKMSNLRHLNLTATCFLPHPLRADDENNSLVLWNLQTLSTIRFASCTKEVFENMPSLKKLRIHETEEDSDSCKGLSSFPSNLFYLHNLETLKCSFNCLNPKKMRLRDWNAFPETLKHLTLNRSYLPWEDMDTLGMLPNLEVLKLKNYAFQGKVWEPNEEGFQNLKLLLIEKTDLVHWRASRENFPCLQFLVLRSCEFLEEIPCDIADYLELIELHYCSSSAESSAIKIQEEQKDMGNDSLVVRIVNNVPIPDTESEDS